MATFSPPRMLTEQRRGLFQHTQFLAHLDEGFDTLVEVAALVSGRNLYADTGLVFRHYRIVETGYINSCDSLASYSMTAQMALWVGLMSNPAAIILSRK